MRAHCSSFSSRVCCDRRRAWFDLPVPSASLGVHQREHRTWAHARRPTRHLRPPYLPARGRPFTAGVRTRSAADRSGFRLNPCTSRPARAGPESGDGAELFRARRADRRPRHAGASPPGAGARRTSPRPLSTTKSSVSESVSGPSGSNTAAIDKKGRPAARWSRSHPRNDQPARRLWCLKKCGRAPCRAARIPARSISAPSSRRRPRCCLRHAGYDATCGTRADRPPTASFAAALLSRPCRTRRGVRQRVARRCRRRAVVLGGNEARELWEAIANERTERADRVRPSHLRARRRQARLLHGRARAPRSTARSGSRWGCGCGSGPARRVPAPAPLRRRGPAVARDFFIFAKPEYDRHIPELDRRSERVSRPAFRRLWDKALDGIDVPSVGSHVPGEVAADGDVDAAWLAEQRQADSFRARPIERFSFGQRVFGTATTTELEDMLVALRGFGRYPALMLTLERIGIRSPRVYGLMVRHARQIEGVDDPRLAVPLLTQFRGR